MGKPTGEGTKHRTVSKTVNGVKYFQGVNVGYNVSVGGVFIPNVGFRSLRDVKRQLIEQGFRLSDIRIRREARKRTENV
jgi:hypothetical protein